MMKRFFILFVTTLLAACICAQAQAAEQDQALDSSPFTLIILGTRKPSDIEVIRKNIKSLKYVNSFIPSQVSQRHLEFTGSYVGPEATLLADIESLSADRYEVKSKEDSRRGLIITLRKIQPTPVESSE